MRISIPVEVMRADNDKTSRLAAVSPLIANGHVYLPDEFPHKLAFLDETSGFPEMDHDDIVDSMVHALTYLKESPVSDNRSIADMRSDLCPAFTWKTTMPDLGWRAPWDDGRDPDGFDERDIIPYL